MIGCGSPEAPEHPTWADVQPILAGECTHCHGANAGNAGSGYRFDFFDMTTEICGDAANGMGVNVTLGKALASQISTAISTTDGSMRPDMPPLPAPFLADWEWQTILRWTADPQRGAPRGSNTPPTIRLDDVQWDALGVPVDKTLDLSAVVDDADGDPVVGVLNIGGHSLKMDRSGSFTTRLDTSSWPAGPIAVSAVLCDGWSNVSYALGSITIAHLK